NDVYADGNPGYAAQHAGSNGSAYGNYITGNGWDNFARVTFRYLLPVGWGHDHLVDDYRLDRGLLVAGASGGASPNPLESGRRSSSRGRSGRRRPCGRAAWTSRRR